MNKLSLFTIVFLACTFTGCINIIEEIFLKKDGSGQYSITMDASAVMEGGGLRGMMQSLGDQGENDQMPDLEGPIEMDTTMYFKDAPADFVKDFSHPELLDKISIHQVISEEKEIMKTVFTLDFEKVSQIDQFLKDFSKLSMENQEMAALGGMMNGIVGGKTLNNEPMYNHAKKMITRAKLATPEQNGVNDETMQMMKMMLADASYKLIYHLPGKVKRTSIPNARVEGKDVFLESSLLETMEGKADLSGWIKFKGR